MINNREIPENFHRKDCEVIMKDISRRDFLKGAAAGAIGLAATGLTGAVAFADDAAPEEKGGLLGDANLDDNVDISDAAWIQRAESHMITLSERAQLLADVDRNGVADIVDATIIQRREARMDVPEGIGEPI